MKTRSKFSISVLQIITIAALASMPLSFTGCATSVVGKAEQGTRLANDTFDTFLQFERAHEAQLIAVDPSIHVYAQKLRHRECPTCDPFGVKLLKTARAYTEAYRLNQTADNKFQLQTALALLQTTLNELVNYTSKASAAGLNPPALPQGVKKKA